MTTVMTPGFNHLSSPGGAKGRALVAGKPIVVRNPDAVRHWQHGLEPLAGYLWLGARMLGEGRRYEGAWNFGLADQAGDHPVRWVVERFLGEWAAGSWVTPGESAPKRWRRSVPIAFAPRECLMRPIPGTC